MRVCFADQIRTVSGGTLRVFVERAITIESKDTILKFVRGKSEWLFFAAGFVLHPESPTTVSVLQLCSLTS